MMSREWRCCRARTTCGEELRGWVWSLRREGRKEKQRARENQRRRERRRETEGEKEGGKELFSGKEDQNLRSIHPRSLIRKTASAPQMRKKLSADDELQDHVQVIGVLKEGKEKAFSEWVGWASWKGTGDGTMVGLGFRV